MRHKKSPQPYDFTMLSEKAQNALHALHLEGIALSPDVLKTIYRHDAGEMSDDEFIQQIVPSVKNK